MGRGDASRPNDPGVPRTRTIVHTKAPAPSTHGRGRFLAERNQGRVISGVSSGIIVRVVAVVVGVAHVVGLPSDGSATAKGNESVTVIAIGLLALAGVIVAGGVVGACWKPHQGRFGERWAGWGGGRGVSTSSEETK